MKRDYDRAIRKIRAQVRTWVRLSKTFPKNSAARAQFMSKAGTFNEVAAWLNEAEGAEEKVSRKR